MSETKTDTKTTANYEALDARLSQPPQEIENPKACFANFLRKIKRKYREFYKEAYPKPYRLQIRFKNCSTKIFFKFPLINFMPLLNND